MVLKPRIDGLQCLKPRLLGTLLPSGVQTKSNYKVITDLINAQLVLSKYLQRKKAYISTNIVLQSMPEILDI